MTAIAITSRGLYLASPGTLLANIGRLSGRRGDRPAGRPQPGAGSADPFDGRAGIRQEDHRQSASWLPAGRPRRHRTERRELAYHVCRGRTPDRLHAARQVTMRRERSGVTPNRAALARSRPQPLPLHPGSLPACSGGVYGHLGLVLEGPGMFAHGTCQAMAFIGIDEQLRRVGLDQPVSIELHEIMVVCWLTIKGNVVRHDDARRFCTARTTGRIPINFLLGLRQITNDAAFEQHHLDKQVLFKRGLLSFGRSETLEGPDPFLGNICPVTGPDHRGIA